MRVQRLHRGITKAALSSDSFLSGASFQESTKVLTEAALRGAEDELIGTEPAALAGPELGAAIAAESHEALQAEMKQLELRERMLEHSSR